MKIDEAVQVLNAHVVYACSKAGLGIETIAMVTNALDVVSEFVDEHMAEPQTDTHDEAIKAMATLIKARAEQTEPKTDWHYDEQDSTWYPYKHKDEPKQTEPNCSEKPNNCEPQIFICPIQDDYEALIEDEPQTELIAQIHEMFADMEKLLRKSSAEIVSAIREEVEKQTDCQWK